MTELSQYHLIFYPFSSDIKLSLIQVLPMLIFTFQSINQTSRIHARDLAKNSHNNNKFQGLKQIIQIKDQELTKFNPLFGFATPRLKKLLTHT